MSNIDTFRRDMAAEVEALLGKIDGAVEKTGLYGWDLITSATPVDTGRARASWLLTVNTIKDDTLSRKKPGKRFYPDPDAPGVKFDITKDRYMYITNNVRYIEYLEEGTDKISPFAMVATAVPKIERELTRRFNNIK